MIQMEELVRKLAGNAQAIQTLVNTVSDDQARWKPDPDTWSFSEVMGHVYNEERIDFRKHLKEMFSIPPQPWRPFRHEELIQVKDMHEALQGFLTERENSIAWLKTLASPDWEVRSEVEFGPSAEKFILSSGDVLLSWVEHDYLHMRQMIELLHAWNEHQAAPYSLQYAGGW